MLIGCEDCDDANGAVAPGLAEDTPQGLDNDCSGGDEACATEAAEPKGCGCTSSSGTPLGAFWGLLGIGLLGWRRR